MGCGFDIKEGYVNLDMRKKEGVDVVHDLNKFPYPFKDNTFDYIYCVRTLEHLDDIVRIMEEVYRILKPGGRIFVRVPYFNHFNTYRDFTHRHAFTLDSFDAFSVDYKITIDPNGKGGNTYFYSDKRFKIVKKELIGTYIGKWIPKRLRNFVGLFIGNIGQTLLFELEKP